MNKDELLKIYSAYLPYGLKVLIDGKDYKNKYWPNYTGEDIVDRLVGIKQGQIHVGGSRIDIGTTYKFKPILYDLSYLTKEIEHEGRKFIPMEELAKEFDMNVIEYNIIKQNAGSTTFDWIRSTAYPVIQRMLEYHLNVFSLSESEYINKATLTQ